MREIGDRERDADDEPPDDELPEVRLALVREPDDAFFAPPRFAAPPDFLALDFLALDEPPAAPRDAPPLERFAVDFLVPVRFIALFVAAPPRFAAPFFAALFLAVLFFAPPFLAAPRFAAPPFFAPERFAPARAGPRRTAAFFPALRVLPRPFVAFVAIAASPLPIVAVGAARSLRWCASFGHSSVPAVLPLHTTTTRSIMHRATAIASPCTNYGVVRVERNARQ
jgi:hypothetical protein